jgi:hypothetical protein
MYPKRLLPHRQVPWSGNTRLNWPCVSTERLPRSQKSASAAGHCSYAERSMPMTWSLLGWRGLVRPQASFMALSAST